MLLLLSVVIHSIVITGIARTTIVKDNGSDALTITNNYNTISNTSRTNNRTNNRTRTMSMIVSNSRIIR